MFLCQNITANDLCKEDIHMKIPKTINIKIPPKRPRPVKRMLLGIAIILIGIRLPDIAFLIAAAIGIGFCIWGYCSKPDF